MQPEACFNCNPTVPQLFKSTRIQKKMLEFSFYIFHSYKRTVGKRNTHLHCKDITYNTKTLAKLCINMLLCV